MRAGLEVHQQLRTGKLFCRCPCDFSETVTGTFVRRLIAASGEDRSIDPAARFQASRDLLYRYEVTPTSCLVEADEEPPHPLDPNALETALIVSRMLGARVVDEVEIMRKIVVDGSNTSGFQRTALIAVDGVLEVDGRRISIDSISLEEDAARKTAEAPGEVTYRLDRLGIPLLEIATAPEITSGREARAVAEEIGALVRATDRVRRGIGSIREDLNVSADGGRRIEIKGVQELRSIEQYVEGEVERQNLLLRIRETLRQRKAKPPAGDPVDLTDLFESMTEGPLAARAGRARRIFAVALPGFAGLLRSPPGSSERLGRELADYARAFGLAGLLHSDELPGYGVDEGRVADVRSRLGLAPEDAFVLLADASEARSRAVAESIARRAAQAIEGIPGETRDPLPDGRTRYSRPIPGRHRMYPETDVPPIPIRPADLARIDTMLPERPSELRSRLAHDYRLPDDLVRQLVAAGEAARFELLAKRGHPATLVARLLTQDLPPIERVSASTGAELSGEMLDAVLRASERGLFAKEGIPAVLRELAGGARDVAAAAERAGLSGLGDDELERVVREVVGRNRALLAERGEEAFQPLMGDVMKVVRGRRDGQEVAQRLRRAIEQARAGMGA